MNVMKVLVYPAILAAVAVVNVGMAVIMAGATNPPEGPKTGVLLGPALVERVVDGDTLVVSGIGTVRLLGIDAPEIHHTTKGPERCGREAAAWLRERVQGKEVVVLVKRLDRYRRALAFVWYDEPARAMGPQLLNRDAIAYGWARNYANESHPWRKHFALDETAISEEKGGLWDDARHCEAIR